MTEDQDYSATVKLYIDDTAHDTDGTESEVEGTSGYSSAGDDDFIDDSSQRTPEAEAQYSEFVQPFHGRGLERDLSSANFSSSEASRTETEDLDDLEYELRHTPADDREVRFVRKYVRLAAGFKKFNPNSDAVAPHTATFFFYLCFLLSVEPANQHRASAT